MLQKKVNSGSANAKKTVSGSEKPSLKSPTKDRTENRQYRIDGTAVKVPR